MNHSRNALPLLVLTFFIAAPAIGQQIDVPRYDIYTGYAFLDSPRIGLFEHGFQTQAGIRHKKWLTLGFDYSYSRGDLLITPNLLPDAEQQQLAAQFALMAKAGLLPPGYTLSVPASSISQTFAMGPQLAYRHFKRLTLFVRPSLGAIYEAATPKPGDPIAKSVVAQLAPAGKKTDWQGFYGVGYGFDIILSRRLAIRTQSDLVYDHLFNDLLKDGRWTARFSIGPAFSFGRNIVE